MQTSDTDYFAKGAMVLYNVSFNFSDKISLEFIDSKLSISVQVSDLIAGVVMRFWNDFINKNESQCFTKASKLNSLCKSNLKLCSRSNILPVKNNQSRKTTTCALDAIDYY